jgi:hypothetical protein
VAIRSIGGEERLEIETRDRIEHKPREMILRQPVPQRRRQQKRLLTITFNEVLGHPSIQRAGPDRPLCATSTAESGTVPS